MSGRGSNEKGDVFLYEHFVLSGDSTLKCPQSREHCFYGLIKSLLDRIRLHEDSIKTKVKLQNH